MRFVLVILSGLLSGVVPEASTAHVFGADDRRPVFDGAGRAAPASGNGLTGEQVQALRAVGRMTCADGARGTAFLIDPESMGLPPAPTGWQLIMSVAHGFYDQRFGNTRGAARESCLFWATQAGRKNGLEISDIQPGTRTPSSGDYAGDYAFGLVPATGIAGLPVQQTQARPFHRIYSHYKAGLAVASFDPDRQTIVIAGDCAAGQYSRMGKHLVGHHCDFEKSASGAPLLDISDGGVKVIGLNFGQTRAPVDPDGNVMPVVDRNRHWNLAILFDQRLVDALRDYLENLP